MVGDMDCAYSLPVDVKTGYKVRKSCHFTLHKDIQRTGGAAPLLLRLSTRWK